jgi:hypothetical protein
MTGENVPMEQTPEGVVDTSLLARFTASQTIQSPVEVTPEDQQNTTCLPPLSADQLRINAEGMVLARIGLRRGQELFRQAGYGVLRVVK